MSVLLPLPQAMTRGGTLRTLRDGVLRVGGAASDLTAIDDLARRALGVGVVRDAVDPDILLVREVVAAPDAVGVDPRPADRAGRPEAHRIRVVDGRLAVSGAGDESFFRALVTVVAAVDGDVLPALELEDHPRFAWRGLSLDVVRRWFPVDEVERIVDLLALHKLNVLHLHLTDVQAWRFAVPGRPALTPDDAHYSADDLDRLVAYARARHITVVPEFDVPGHVAATVAESGVAVTTGAHPFVRHLDWEAPGVAAFVRDALAELAGRCDAPYLHLGGDEAFGAPHEVYTTFLRAAAAEVRALGRRVLGWQEAIRADALQSGDLVQLWIAERDRFDADRVKATVAEELHPLVDEAAALFAESVHDAGRIGARGIPVIVSASDPLYLDRRPAEPSRDDAQNARLAHLGNPGYDATPSTDVLRWDPFAQSDIRRHGITVAGIEAALWCESVRDLDDVALLLLPRLALVAQRAWGGEDAGVDDVLAAARGHERHWAALGFRNIHRSTEVFS